MAPFGSSAAAGQTLECRDHVFASALYAVLEATEMVRKLCLPEALEANAHRFDVPRDGVVDFAQIGWVQVSADLRQHVQRVQDRRQDAADGVQQFVVARHVQSFPVQRMVSHWSAHTSSMVVSVPSGQRTTMSATM